MLKQKYTYKKEYGPSMVVAISVELFIKFKEQIIQNGQVFRSAIIAAVIEWLKTPIDKQAIVLSHIPKFNSEPRTLTQIQMPFNLAIRFHNQAFARGFRKPACISAAMIEWMKLPVERQAILLCKIPRKNIDAKDININPDENFDSDSNQLPCVGVADKSPEKGIIT
jgi:hypothetical protein